MPDVARREDRFLLFLTGILVLVGLMMIYSASNVIAFKKYGESNYFLIRQLIWTALGVALLYGVSWIPYRFWQKWAIALTLGTFVLLGLILIPGLGVEVNGARRWFRVGPFAFQPSEFAKLALIIYVAHYLAKHHEREQERSDLKGWSGWGRTGYSGILRKVRQVRKGPTRFLGGLLPVLSVAGLGLVLIVVEPDLGTTVTLGLVILMMLFVGGAKLLHLSMLGLCLLPVLAYLILGTEYRRQRWLSYLDPWQDPSDTGFQIIQSFLAFGAGGEFGVGLGEGRQKLFFLPYPHTDFIFSVIGEELGLVGTLIVLFCFMLLVWRGIRLSTWVTDPFGQFLAVGITLMIGLSALINLGVVTGLLPTKGLPLPFLSYGGSSLLANLVGVGLLLSISRYRETL